MATLDALQESPPARLLTGVALKIFPANLGFDIVVERAPDASGSPGSWAQVTRFRPKRFSGQVIQDRLPLNGNTYWYRCKSAAIGYADSDYTVPITAVPTVLTGQEDADLSDLDYIGKLPAGTVARQAHGVYLETFEADPGWIQYEGAGVLTFPAITDGSSGGHALHSAGYSFVASRDNIPFDPSKLYRVRCRVRLVTAPTSGVCQFYAGVLGVASDGYTLVNRSGANTYGTQHYVGANAINLLLLTPGTWVETTGWFKGVAASGGFAPTAVLANQPGTAAALHEDVRYIRPVAVLSYNGGAASDAVVELDEIAIDVFDEESQTRIYTLSDSSTVISAATTQNDGTQARALVKGRQRFVARDGDTITFNPPFQNLPQGTYVQGGISYQPNSKWGVGSPGALPPLAKPQYQEVTFVGLNTNSCTLRAWLRQKNTTITARTDNFAAGTIDAEGEDKEANIANGPAYDSNYLVSWTGSITAKVAGSKTPDYCDIDLTFVIESKSSAGSYTIRATRSYHAHASGLGNSTTVNIGGSVTINASEINLNGDVRIRITDINISGNPLFPDTSVSLDPTSVQYQSGTNADQVASMTPDTDDRIIVEFEDAG